MKRSHLLGILIAWFCCIGPSGACFAGVQATFDRIKHKPPALYAFLKDLPKGGELHYHLAGSVYPETMLVVAAEKNYCLNPRDFVMSPMLEGCTGVRAADLAAKPELYQQTIRAWSMKDFVPGSESGHDHFFAAFYKFLAIVTENPVLNLAEVMQRAANQNESYMEIMIMPDGGVRAEKINLPVIPQNFEALKQHLQHDPEVTDWVEKSVARTDALLPETRARLGCERFPKQKVCEVTVRFQYHVLREQPLPAFFAQALSVFMAASRSQAVVGVNLVQPEDGIISLRDYQTQMQIFDFMHRAWPEVAIALHAGELGPQDVPPEALRFHIHDAVHTGHARRIGHGVDIAFEDQAEELLAYMAAQQIAVEINLSSNQAVLNVSGSRHPLKYYRDHQVPVVLSTDDEGILRTDLTREYVKAVLQHGLDYPDLKQISRNALTYAFLPGQSLWADPQKAVLRQPCAQLKSTTCDQFVAHSEKATLQRALEFKFEAFEARFKKA